MKAVFRPLFLVILLIQLKDVCGQLSPGSQAPSIELSDAAGKTISLSTLKGKWVLVDFWASWCLPCRASNRVVRKMYPQWKEKGLEVLGVSLDGNRRDWLKAIQQDRITWVQVNTPAQWDSQIVQQWKFDRIPTTYLVDPNGVIRAVDPEPKVISSLITTAYK